MKNLKSTSVGLRYAGMIGTGGIGSGTFLSLEGNHTLGREESRPCRILDRRDYCKLHIISHYVKSLLGAGFEVIPVGKVGDDEAGKRLLREMQEAGLATGHVRTVAGLPTLFSYCFLYPNGSGGNLTTADSASGHVAPADIRPLENDMRRLGRRGVALAVPEVPLSARDELLELARKHGLFSVASFTSGEMQEAVERKLFPKIDLLAVNADEAGLAAGIPPDSGDAAMIAAAAIQKLAAANPAMWISVTGGSAGSWAWDGTRISHVPVFCVPVASTAGAGDAHISGMIAGLALGLKLPAAQILGSLHAALSVTSPHTIHSGIDRESLRKLAGSSAGIPADVLALLEE